MVRVEFAERIPDVVDVDEGFVRGHPRVRVGVARIVPGGDRDGLDSLGDHAGGDVERVGELLKPQFQVHAVGEEEVSGLGTDQVAGGGLIFVDLRTDPGDGFHAGVLPGDVARHVSEDGEGGEHDRPVVVELCGW